VAAAAAPARQAPGAVPVLRPTPRPAPGRAARSRRLAARRARALRLFVVAVVVVTALAVGRVAVSFAVVQKSLATDAVAQQTLRLDAENARLREEVARLAAAGRLRHLATGELGLTAPEKVTYLRLAAPAGAAGAEAGR